MASLTAAVTSLGNLISWNTTVLGDVATLTTRVTLDGASLAILGKVVWSTALVARRTLVVTAETWLSLRSSASRSGGGGSTLVLWTLTGNVAELGAVVTFGALGRVWTVTLDVANVSTRVALLRVGGFWFWASRRLVAA